MIAKCKKQNKMEEKKGKVFDREFPNAVQGITTSLSANKACDVCPI